MSWQLKLSNWLSNGALLRNQKQAELAKAKLKQQELTIENLNARITQGSIEVEQLVAQLQISQGFQVELGETQLKLREAIAASENCRQQLPALQQQVAQLKNKLQQTQKNLSKSQNWLEQLQNNIKVVDIQKRLPKEQFDCLWGFGVNSPEVGEISVAGSVLIKGWALGRKSPVTHIRIDYQQETIVETLVNLSRPQVTNRYPEIPNANKSGFEASISVVSMPAEVELELKAILQDETILPLCAILLKKEA
ncbi:MAG: hypothetical protein AAGA80_11690 [Cyanobacteria bacterium P01_F01_bin.143]